MKTAIMVVVGVELAMLISAWLGLAFANSRSDLAGQGMTAAYAIIGSVVALLFMIPAFAMAYYGKLPWLALSLAVVAAFFALFALASVFLS